jgi:hypothetical protein
MARWKRYRGDEYTSNNRIIVGRVVSCVVCVVSKGSRRLILPRTSCMYIRCTKCARLSYKRLLSKAVHRGNSRIIFRRDLKLQLLFLANSRGIFGTFNISLTSSINICDVEKPRPSWNFVAPDTVSVYCWLNIGVGNYRFRFDHWVDLT